VSVGLKLVGIMFVVAGMVLGWGTWSTRTMAEVRPVYNAAFRRVGGGAQVVGRRRDDKEPDADCLAISQIYKMTQSGRCGTKMEKLCSKTWNGF
jgi:hypothetical protein